MRGRSRSASLGSSRSRSGRCCPKSPGPRTAPRARPRRERGRGVRPLLPRGLSEKETSMPGTGTSTPGAQRTRIVVEQEPDVAHWARKLDATPEQVKDAVKAVGGRPDDAEMHLKGVRSTTNSDTTKRGND